MKVLVSYIVIQFTLPLTALPHSFRDLSLELLHIHVIPPVMYILEPQHLPDLPVRQGSFVFSHLPGDLDVRVILLQDLGGGF